MRMLLMALDLVDKMSEEELRELVSHMSEGEIRQIEIRIAINRQMKNQRPKNHWFLRDKSAIKRRERPEPPQ